MLLHSLKGASPELGAFELALRGHGFHVATPPLKGLQDRTLPSFWHWIVDSVAEVDRLAATHQEINLCGVSDGAALALAVAAERPTKVDGLALISPALSLSPRAISLWTSLLLVSEWVADWRLRLRPWLGPAKAKTEGASDAPGRQHEPRKLTIDDSVMSPSQRREARRLVRHVRDSLERVRTPTIAIHGSENAAAASDIRYIQVHIGSQFLQVFLEPSNRLIADENASEQTALKVTEFFNETARRRDLARL